MLVSPLMLFCCSDGKTRHTDEKWTTKKMHDKRWKLADCFFFLKVSSLLPFAFLSTLLIMACQCFPLCRQAHPISSLSFSLSQWFLTLTAQSGSIKRNFVKQMSEEENVFHSQLDGHFSSISFITKDYNLQSISLTHQSILMLSRHYGQWVERSLSWLSFRLNHNICAGLCWLGTKWPCDSRDLQ